MIALHYKNPVGSHFFLGVINSELCKKKRKTLTIPASNKNLGNDFIIIIYCIFIYHILQTSRDACLSCKSGTRGWELLSHFFCYTCAIVTEETGQNVKNGTTLVENIGEQDGDVNT